MKQAFGAPPRQARQVYQWDKIVPGLGIRVNINGSRYYVARIHYKDRDHWQTIGPVELLDLTAVRQLVGKMKMLVKNGKDSKPALEQFVLDQAVPQQYGITFDDFADIYIEKYAKVHKKSWLKDKQRIDLYLRPIWGDRLLYGISRADVADIHSIVGKTTPTAANRLLETISVLFKQAILWGHIPEKHLAITAGIRRFRERPRERFLTDEERTKIFEQLDTIEASQFQIAALKLDFETGFRCGEIIALKWENVRLDKGEIYLPDTKAGRSFTQPLTQTAVSILKELPRRNQWVFPSMTKRNNHIARMDKLFRKVISLAGIEHTTIHDIRRYVGSSILGQTGSLKMVAQLLNQTSLQTTKVYGRLDQEHKRKVLESHSAGMHGSPQPLPDDPSVLNFIKPNRKIISMVRRTL